MITLWTIAYVLLVTLVVLTTLLLLPMPLFFRKSIVRLLKNYRFIYLGTALVFSYLAYEAFNCFSKQYTAQSAKASTTSDKFYMIMDTNHRCQRNFYISTFGLVLSLVVFRLISIQQDIIAYVDQIQQLKKPTAPVLAKADDEQDDIDVKKAQ